MTIPASVLANSDHIRKLDLASDLDQVADLIEMCFPISGDPDGQSYIREMRKAAREMRLLGWLSSLADMGSAKSAGFVWEESNKIYGNLSLIPFQKDGRRMHLIANVAVHPSRRREGIARALTQHALSYLRQRGDRETWLQVRDDNAKAIDLYRSVGFEPQASRTTWRIRPKDCQCDQLLAPGKLTLTSRDSAIWQQQQVWLQELYPLELRWNLPVDFNRFKPDLFQGVANFLDGFPLKHWAFQHEGDLQGIITWQQTSMYANNLWLAFPEGCQADILACALAYVVKHRPRRHPLSIDFPKNGFIQIFESLGFMDFRTLIWMRCQLNK